MVYLSLSVGHQFSDHASDTSIPRQGILGPSDGLYTSKSTFRSRGLCQLTGSATVTYSDLIFAHDHRFNLLILK